jgi:hypothetical protein
VTSPDERQQIYVDDVFADAGCPILRSFFQHSLLYTVALSCHFFKALIYQHKEHSRVVDEVKLLLVVLQLLSRLRGHAHFELTE